MIRLDVLMMYFQSFITSLNDPVNKSKYSYYWSLMIPGGDWRFDSQGYGEQLFLFRWLSAVGLTCGSTALLVVQDPHWWSFLF
ncbi:hypothetical protein HanIR_Chr04g0164391 [Helianthus annuus]|nr:hypothetical protein HanIR_Chr04g0164391 [Helianthus annuus]